MDDSVRQMLELSRLENGVQALRRTEFLADGTGAGALAGSAADGILAAHRNHR